MKTLPIIIGIILIAFIAFLALRPGEQAVPVTEETPMATVIPTTGPEFLQVVPSVVPDVVLEDSSADVAIDDTAFTPSTITVPVGTTVVFTNNGQAPHWPASDPHPVHTDLSAFDAKKGLATGEKYSYTFTTKGTFSMHDHLNARIKGSIVVQ
jgi:plastocyanin